MQPSPLWHRKILEYQLILLDVVSGLHIAFAQSTLSESQQPSLPKEYSKREWAMIRPLLQESLAYSWLMIMELTLAAHRRPHSCAHEILTLRMCQRGWQVHIATFPSNF